MIATLKSEFLKLLTVRSTYIVLGLTYALVVLFAFYFEGYKGNTGSAASLLDVTAYKEIVNNAAGLGVLFISIITATFMAHEYRYGLIMYTLTANTKRTQVYLAKLFVASVFGVIAGCMTVLFAIICYRFGVAVRGADLPAQDFNILSEFGGIAFYYACYALIGVIVTILTRSIVVAIGVLLIFPTTVEPLLGIVFKDNAKYLPFTAIDSTVGASVSENTLSTSNAMVVSLIYIAVMSLITWLIFMRRDAN